MPEPTRIRRAPLMLLAALLAACGGDDPVEPLPDYDPALTLAELDEVVSPLDASENVFLGLYLATAALTDYGAAALGGTVSVSFDALRGAAPTGRQRLPDPQRLRRLAAGLTRGSGDAVAKDVASLTIPTDLRGTTLVWDAAQGYVPSSRTGAPAAGVRLVLYAMDTETGDPSQPLTEIGHIDLTDEDRTLSERVGVTVVETGDAADVLLADYYVDLAGSGTDTEGTLDLQAAGEIGDADGRVQFTLLQQYAWSQSNDTDGLVLDYILQAPGAASAPVRLAVQAQSAFNAAYWASVSFNATFDPTTAEEVEVDISIDSTNQLSGGVWKAGRQVIRVGGVDGDPYFERTDDKALSQAEEAALDQIWTGVANLVTLGEWVLVPSDLLFLDG